MNSEVAESCCTVELHVSVFGVEKIDKHGHTSCLDQLLPVALCIATIAVCVICVGKHSMV